MLAAGVGAQAGHGVAADGVGGDHALHGKLHGKLRLGLHQGVIAGGLQVADVPGVAVVVLLLRLAAGEDGVLAVDDDDMVAAVHMGSEGDLVLAPQEHGSLSGYTAQRLARGVDDIPFAVDLTGFRHCGRHSFRPPKFVACI